MAQPFGQWVSCPGRVPSQPLVPPALSVVREAAAPGAAGQRTPTATALPAWGSSHSKSQGCASYRGEINCPRRNRYGRDETFSSTSRSVCFCARHVCQPATSSRNSGVQSPARSGCERTRRVPSCAARPAPPSAQLPPAPHPPQPLRAPLGSPSRAHMPGGGRVWGGGRPCPGEPVPARARRGASQSPPERRARLGERRPRRPGAGGARGPPAPQRARSRGSLPVPRVTPRRPPGAGRGAAREPGGGVGPGPLSPRGSG